MEGYPALIFQAKNAKMELNWGTVNSYLGKRLQD